MNSATETPLGLDTLRLDPQRATDAIVAAIQSQVLETLRRKGAVVGLSGGIDSSVVAALCVRALGPARVLGLFMPERDSSQETIDLSRALANHLGILSVLEDITGVLDAAGCYRRRDEAIRQVFPQYGPGCRAKIVLPSVLEGSPYRVFSVVIESPGGDIHRKRLPLDAYQTIVAATNFKQRVRKMMEYFHADRLNFAVAGTPNRLEYDQGFFVKGGDGAADFKPIAHLYKTQVYQLAEYLGVPEAIRTRPPTTDTYSMPQSQEEFFFSLPFDKMDLCLFGRDHDVPPAELAAALGLSPEQVQWVYRDIDAKRQFAQYLHAAPMLVEPLRRV
ncbi:MAG: NAD(+) synthase [Pirellulales bacterium]|nr:NAD(+) synthase [Pirellulales bacterium]